MQERSSRRKDSNVLASQIVGRATDEARIVKNPAAVALGRLGGLKGGKGGAPSESIINPDTENRHIGKITMNLKKDDVYRLITSGGGGWGDPLERDPKMVLDDVRNEKVSVRRAREAYGVVINKLTMELDIAETRKLREAIKEARR